MLEVAEQTGSSPDRVAIAWAGTHGAVPIIGPRSLAQLESNLGAAALTLSAEQIARLNAASAPAGAPPRATTRAVA
ncbi:aldo/keto reductase [Allomesorhizobium camelthorni]|uniref:aldo/keto reductase n=1 Tax=Allomesorhizobium camelthorni TaxID=475069 RepID=UPI0031B640AF